jgi:hypothetical protein
VKWYVGRIIEFIEEVNIAYCQNQNLQSGRVGNRFIVAHQIQMLMRKVGKTTLAHPTLTGLLNPD